jgi:hypothetical protein
MDHIFISLGGTGAKTATAFAHLVAMGACPAAQRGDQLRFWLVDSEDPSNTGTALEGAATAAMDIGALLGPEWALPTKKSPTGAVVARVNPAIDPDGDNFWTLASRFATDASLLPLFYTAADASLPLKEGFFRRASVGGLFAGRSLEARPPAQQKDTANFKALLNDVPQPCKIVIATSLNGGTGAACLPTILKVIRDSKPEAEILCLILLPYHAIPGTEKAPQGTTDFHERERQRIADGVVIQQDEEVPRSKGGLRSLQTIAHKATWLLVGPEEMTILPEYRSSGQRNPPHAVEYQAGLIATQYFGNHLQMAPSNAHVLSRPLRPEADLELSSWLARTRHLIPFVLRALPFGFSERKWPDVQCVRSFREVAGPMASARDRLEKAHELIQGVGRQIDDVPEWRQQAVVTPYPAGSDWGKGTSMGAWLRDVREHRQASQR